MAKKNGCARNSALPQAAELCGVAKQARRACQYIGKGLRVCVVPTPLPSLNFAYERQTPKALPTLFNTLLVEPSCSTNLFALINMSRVMQFAIFVFFALAAFAAVVRADDKVVDEEGREVVFFDSKVGDLDFEDDATEKRSLNIRGKSSFGLSPRHIKENSFTHGPNTNEKLQLENVKITWYASEDLKNPACGDENWNPNNKNHIGAVQKSWTNGPQCGEFVRLCNPKVERCVKVRIVDECAGCAQNHVDLTKSAFKHLATTGTLDEGITTGLQMYASHNPNPWDFSLFGPLKLKN